MNRPFPLPRVVSLALVCPLLCLLPNACTQNGRTTNGAAATQPHRMTAAPATQPDEAIARIRDEGLNRSQAMDTLDHLCNVIGPRLTGSPGGRRANEWTRETLTSWGMENAHLEAWGPFGRGWQVRRFSMQVVEPYTIVLNGYPKAWSPGFDKPFEAPVVYIDATREADLEKYKGKLKGAVVLAGKTRDVQARFEPLASRLDDERLERLASAQPGSSAMMGQARAQTASERRAQFAESGARGEALARGRTGRATEPATQPATSPSGRRRFDPFASRLLSFVADEGAAVVITGSTVGDGGTFFVSAASVPGDTSRSTGAGASPTTEPTTAPTTGPTTRPRVWATDAPKVPPQVMLAIEDYNRLARMIQRGEKPTMAVDMRVDFFDDDEMAYNTIAEIPGTDPELKDEIVMVGAHLDSWHSGTGATDNAVGSACAMEAVRIIKAAGLQPRRTIRVALWTGEEQGLYGSAAYVKKHFGHDPDRATRGQRPAVADPAAGASSDNDNRAAAAAAQPATRPARRVVKERDYEKLSVYFNLDNGTGKIRGIYAQGNAAAVPLFKSWLAHFTDLGASTVTLSNTGGTDHQSFDAINLPGFQFIQDPIEYSSRTHHSNYDVYDRLQAEDVKQASTIMAAFVYKAAMMDERFPRKAVEGAPSR